MKQPTESSPGRRGAAFNSLRFQVIAIMLLCYLVPALLLGVFTQTVLIKSMRRKTDAALTAGVEYAWTLTAQNVERAIALSRDAIYDGELADAYERYRGKKIWLAIMGRTFTKEQTDKMYAYVREHGVI